MTPVKRTYALPLEIVERFEQVVSPGKRSAVLAELMNCWVEEQKRIQLRKEIAEGCKEMWDVMLETEEEYRPLDEEVARAHYDDQAR